MKKVKYSVYVFIVFCVMACQPHTTTQQKEASSKAASVETIPAVIRRIANGLPLSNANASAFFESLDSVEIKNENGPKQEVKGKRYTFYYTTDSTQITSIWMDLDPDYELTMEQLNNSFKTEWKPASSNNIDIKTEDAVVHKKYSYPTSKGMIDITIYSKHEKITGLLMEFSNKL